MYDEGSEIAMQLCLIRLTVPHPVLDPDRLVSQCMSCMRLLMRLRIGSTPQVKASSMMGPGQPGPLFILLATSLY